MYLPDPNLTCEKRSPSPFNPSSGCTVTTKELVTEAEIAIRTFQKQHGNVPVYVICDEVAGDHLDRQWFEGPVIVERRELTSPESVKRHNEYHRPDAILWKMEVLQNAVDKTGDSVFFDADVIFLERLCGPDDCEVALSHNLTCMPAEHEGKFHGFFNAGLVWTCNPKFPSWWKHYYLFKGGFYEQTAINLVPKLFRTGYFHFAHNYGFWRGEANGRDVKSFHCHLATTIDDKMPEFMLRCMRGVRRTFWERVAKKDKVLSKSIRKILGHPEKIFFIHFGKAGGIYTHQMMRRQIIPDYTVCDPWIKGLGRDWTNSELEEIISSETEDRLYLHQHQIATTQENVEHARANGWKTFMFIREPGETICSLYFWRKLTIAKEQKDWFLHTPDLREIPMDEFWRMMLTPEYRRHWMLPEYVDLIDHVDVFSDLNVARFANKWFGYGHLPWTRQNVSGNPGVEECVQRGLITQQMVDDLHATPEYAHYLEFTKSL